MTDSLRTCLPSVIWGQVVGFATLREICTWARTSRAFRDYCRVRRQQIVAPIVALAIGGEGLEHDLAVRLAVAAFAVHESLIVHIPFNTMLHAVSLLVRACIQTKRPLELQWLSTERPIYTVMKMILDRVHLEDHVLYAQRGVIAFCSEVGGIVPDVNITLCRPLVPYDPALVICNFDGPRQKGRGSDVLFRDWPEKLAVSIEGHGIVCFQTALGRKTDLDVCSLRTGP